jgi:Aldo/keto reductase family
MTFENFMRTHVSTADPASLLIPLHALNDAVSQLLIHFFSCLHHSITHHMTLFLRLLMAAAVVTRTALAFTVHSLAGRAVISSLAAFPDGSSIVPSPEVNRREVWTTAACVAATGLILPQSAIAAGATVPVTIPKVRLGNGSLEVSRTIQGYWQLAGGHGRYRESDAIDNMKAHFDAGITTLDTADIYGPSELIMGKFLQTQPKAIPCTKLCCFRYLEEIDRAEVRLRIQKVSFLYMRVFTYVFS